MSLVSGKYHEPEEPYGDNMASEKAEIRHVFCFTFFPRALPPVILYLSGPHVYGSVALSKVSTLETVFKSLRLPYAFNFRRIRVWTLSVTATKCLRIQTNPDTCGRDLGKFLTDIVPCSIYKVFIINTF